MKHFPKEFAPKNRNTFPEHYTNRCLAYLRKTIFDLVLNRSYTTDQSAEQLAEAEDVFVDLDLFKSEMICNTDIVQQIVSVIREELKSLGWKTQMSYGGTGLFIFSEETPPSCH
jgi:hypothetical protein